MSTNFLRVVLATLLVMSRGFAILVVISCDIFVCDAICGPVVWVIRNYIAIYRNYVDNSRDD